MYQTVSSPVLAFDVLRENGDGLYLLFVDNNHPAKHDILVTDFVGSFPKSKDAMDYYEKMYDGSGEPPALIAKFDGVSLVVKYRYDVSVYGDSGWSEAWDYKEE